MGALGGILVLWDSNLHRDVDVVKEDLSLSIAFDFPFCEKSWISARGRFEFWDELGSLFGMCEER